jgi:histidinol phosphatase-like enzyme
MILQAAADLDLDLRRSALVGNEMRDMEAAAEAGIALRIRLDPAGTPVGSPSHHVVRELREACAILRAIASKKDTE